MSIEINHYIKTLLLLKLLFELIKTVLLIYIILITKTIYNQQYFESLNAGKLKTGKSKQE